MCAPQRPPPARTMLPPSSPHPTVSSHATPNACIHTGAHVAFRRAQST